MERRRVVVTGVGAVSPIGNDAKTMWENAKKGVNGIGPITRYDASNDVVKLAGEIKDFDLSSKLSHKEIKRLDRFTQLALVSTEEALKDAKLDFSNTNSHRVGVYFTSGIGGLETISLQKDRASEKGYQRLSPFFIPSAIINLAAGNIAIKFNIHGPSISHVTACASSTNSVGEAFRAIRDGYLDVVVSGGSEATVIPFGIWGFTVMQALNKGDNPNRASIPFDAERSGFVLSEGSATLILESYEHAKARGAQIYGEIVGYGTTSDANHITSPDPEGKGASRCMVEAIKDAGLKPTDVDYINAHGTSTPLNDITETIAIKDAFNDHAYQLNVSSTKSMTGHLLGASGAIEAIMSVLATRDDFIPPTINTKTLDKGCDLNYTLGEGVQKTVNIAISNSLGFGGHNATVVFKKYKEDKTWN
jgi:3-oxoacyl-[acyl-carrier-protein] synthase II